MFDVVPLHLMNSMGENCVCFVLCVFRVSALCDLQFVVCHLFQSIFQFALL